MPDKTDRPDNTWPTLGFLKAVQHPVFRNTLNTLLVVIDRQGQIVFTNHAFQAASGFSKDEMTGMHFCMLFPASQRDSIKARFEQLCIGQLASDFIIPLRDKSGDDLYIHWVTATLTDPDGAIEYIVGTGTDTTAHRNTLISFEKSRMRFQDLVETCSDWIWETDAEYHFTYSSPQVEAILGYHPKEIIGKTLFNFMPTDEVNRLTRHFRKMEKATSIEHELNVKRHKDGHGVMMETSAVPFFSDKGELLGFRGIARDITDRQNTLQALKKSEERLRLSQKFANIGNWEWDIVTGELLWSEQMWVLFGLPTDSFALNFERYLERVHPDDRNILTNAINDSINHETIYDIEHRIIWPDGSIHWLRETGNVIRGSHGKPIRMLGLTSNIDQRKLLEQEQARQADQQRNLLIREVHHRIKNNLQGIVGLLRNNLTNMTDDPGAMVNKAITQINSIALIHGIHGQHDGRELLLCELLPAIVDGHTSPHQGASEIDLSLTIDNPLQLLDKEAVPVALILNEFITNALKHANRRDEYDRVSVSLQVINSRGEINIHCPGGRLPAGFDFETGSGHGTGLKLIRALLPPEGMSIKYRQTCLGVITSVLLQAPIVRPYTSPVQGCCT